MATVKMKAAADSHDDEQIRGVTADARMTDTATLPGLQPFPFGLSLG
jgi:hypothetical protein